MLTLPTKDPSEVLDYQVDFTAALGSDTITGSPVVTASGVTVAGSPAPSQAAGVVTFWLTGGTAGTTGIVTVRVVTTGGRTIERSASIYIEDL